MEITALNNIGAKKRGRPSTTGGARVSQASWLSPGMIDGFGFVPRKKFIGALGSTETQLMSIEAILALAATDPLRALTYLPEVVPEVSKSVWNSLRLGCGENAVRMRAIARNPSGTGVVEKPEGTEAVRALFESLPPEVGSFTGALQQNFLMLLFSGMSAVEAVPGPRNKGVAEVWPLDTLSLQFRRNKQDKRLYLWQRQRVLTGTKGSIPVYGGFMQLPPDRTFWTSIDGFPDDPYGRAPMSATLMPILELMAFMKDLLLAWHRVGTPKWDIGFDYEMWARIAREELGLADKEQITEYIEEQFDHAIELFESLQADDAFFHDIQSKVSVNGSGGHWPNVKEIWEILRWRLITAMHDMPTLMGVVEGNTETWSSVDWQIYAASLMTMVQKAAQPLIQAANLHLRLLGMPYIVEAVYAPIRANQRMVDAQSEQLEIENEAKKRDQGWQTQDEASIAITGSAAVGEPNKEMLQVKPPPTEAKNSEGKKPAGPSKAN